MVEDKGVAPAPGPQLPADGERFLPEIMHGEIELEHVHRYRFASQFVADKEVLDIASGEGYGSAVLAQSARNVIGVDIDQQTIDHARSKYRIANLEFRVGSCAQIPLDDKSVDVVVSFETIEHHAEHEAMVLEIKRVLRPGGLLVISSPDRLTYSDKPNFHNPHHVKELYRDEFETLLGAHFKRFRVHGQRILFGSSIFPGTDRGKVAFENMQSDKVSLGQPSDPVYLVALASDGKLPAVSGSLLEGEPANRIYAGSTLVTHVLTRAVRLVAQRDSATLSAALRDPWYLERNADLVAAKLDPVQHWLSFGADEGRVPAADMPALVRAILAEREGTVKDQIEQLLRDAAQEGERNLAQAFSNLQQEIAADRLGIAAKLESAVALLRQTQVHEAEAVQAHLVRASAEMQVFRAEVQSWRDSSVTPWIEEQRRTLEEQTRAIEVLAQRLAVEAQANTEWRALAEEDRKVAERNALSQFRANRILSNQLSAVQAQVDANHEQMLRRDKAIDDRIGLEAAQATEREQRLLSRLEDMFVGKTEFQRVVTEQHKALQADRQRLTQQLDESHKRHLRLVAASSAALADLRSTWTWRTSGPIRALVDRLTAAASVSRGRTEIDGASTSFVAPRARVPIEKAGSLAELLAHEGGAFVICAYMTLLNRPPDATGYPHYLSRLREEGDKIAILRALLESAEGRRQTTELPGLRAILARDRMKSRLGLRFIARHRQRQRRFRQLLLELSTIHEGESARPAPLAGQALPGDSTADAEARGSVEADNQSNEAVDPAWYLSVYPDVEAAGIDPYEHYRRYGRDDGRLPSPMALLRTHIDVEKYIEVEPELLSLGVDPLQHYLSFGQYEHRTSGVSLALLQFDAAWYLKYNPDVHVAGVDALQHFSTKGILQGRSSSSFRGLDRIEPEPLSYFEPLSGLKAKLIAFYLPQYHPIPENDEWWGKGFTEWTNVSRARPFYKDHDQPRLPGELGFYDLRLVENMKRQAELARIHGIHAFCFYVYWFGGKRLLERPVDEFLRQSDIDISFCLCWANENWTRRWDGLDSDVLIGQSHSPEDDLAFIAEISRAFADPRYLRVGGRPVLVVYRPELLPDSRATTKRWRKWCRDNGIGEIHLCFTKSFGSSKPSALGMDAVIEFPPLATATQEITDNVAGLDPAFRGQVHNYMFTSKGAATYVRPKYLEYRGVMPSWDNTPRKLERSVSYYGATPELYAEWLRSSVDETCKNLPPENRLVFINAWNEWGEGAYIEPDRRRGYAYLSRTREVMANFSSSMVADSELLAKDKATARVAIIVHLHYSDLLEHIAGYLRNVPEAVDLYFSVREGAFKLVRQAVKSCFPTATVVSYPNHGRDVVPFLRILTHIRGFGYGAICKVHSKKSRHRKDGDRWRDDVLERLLGNASRIESCLNLIRAGHGIVAPAGHLMAGATYWGSNAKRVTELALRMQCPHEWLQDFEFPAGTMFWFQPRALEPLMALGLQPTDFEDEAGQVDGTTAHAVERLIGLSARKAGFSVVATPDGTADDVAAYPFAASTSADGKPLDA